MTDRDILIALVAGLGALAERLTGDKLILTINCADGHSHRVAASDSINTEWLKSNTELQGE